MNYKEQLEHWISFIEKNNNTVEKETLISLFKNILSELNKLSEIEKIINNVLYFDDSSDYGTSLWEALKVINPELDEYESLSYMED